MHKLLFVLLSCQIYANDLQSMQSKLHQNIHNLNITYTLPCTSYEELFTLAININSTHDALLPIDDDSLSKLLLVQILGTFNNGLNNESEDLSKLTQQYKALKFAQDNNNIDKLNALTLFIVETFDSDTKQENLLNASCLAIALWASLKYEEANKSKPLLTKNTVFAIASAVLAASLIALIVIAMLPANNNETIVTHDIIDNYIEHFPQLLTNKNFYNFGDLMIKGINLELIKQNLNFWVASYTLAQYSQSSLFALTVLTNNAPFESIPHITKTLQNYTQHGIKLNLNDSITMSKNEQDHLDATIEFSQKSFTQYPILLTGRFTEELQKIHDISNLDLDALQTAQLVDGKTHFIATKPDLLTVVESNSSKKIISQKRCIAAGIFKIESYSPQQIPISIYTNGINTFSSAQKLTKQLSQAFIFENHALSCNPADLFPLESQPLKITQLSNNKFIVRRTAPLTQHVISITNETTQGETIFKLSMQNSQCQTLEWMQTIFNITTTQITTKSFGSVNSYPITGFIMQYALPNKTSTEHIIGVATGLINKNGFLSQTLCFFNPQM